MNHVILCGNLTRDPETKFTPKGTACTEATVAVSERWTTDAGEQKERTAFVSLVLWGRSGEVFAQHHRRGSKALIHGKLVQDTWEDKETGKKREKTRVQVERWEFVGSKREGEPAAPAPAGRPAPKASPETAADAPRAEDDDVPF